MIRINSNKTSMICNKNIKYSTLDFKKVKIETSLTKLYENKFPKFNLNLYYDGKRATKKGILGTGTYGVVFNYKYDNGKFIAVKIPKKYILEEPNILNNVLKNIKNCRYRYLIPSAVIKDQIGNPFIVMKTAEGDLYSIVKYLNLKQKNEIAIRLMKSINCFSKKGICIPDIKLVNILYTCTDNNIEIFLADIGDFEKYNKEGFFTSTFLPPEFFKIKEKNWETNYNVTLYTLGMTLVSLFLNIRINSGVMKKNTKEYTEKYNKMVVAIEESNLSIKNKEMLLKLTEKDPLKRSKYKIDQFI